MPISRRDFLAAGAGALAASRLPLHAQDDDGLIVHEWGVVTIALDSTAWGNVRTAGAKGKGAAEMTAGVPAFVQSWEAIVGAEIINWKDAPQAVDKPIVYFYAKKKAKVSFKVSVPAGRPKLWWPHVTTFAPQFEAPRHFYNDGDPVPKTQDIKPEKGLVEWRDLVLDPDATLDKPVDGWWTAARETDATPIRCTNGPFGNDYGRGGLQRINQGGRLAPRGPEHRERFLYYDALTPVAHGITVAWTKDGVTVTNRDHAKLPFVAAIRVRKGEAACNSAADLEKGKSVTLKPTKDDVPLTEALIKAGLYEKEAVSLMKIWRDEWFAIDGARVLAVLPRQFYDTLLPAEVTPAPKEFTRVLIAQLEALDPEMEADVLAAIRRLGSDSLEERDDAMKLLRHYGPRAERVVRAAAAKETEAEIKARLMELLK